MQLIILDLESQVLFAQIRYCNMGLSHGNQSLSLEHRKEVS